MGLTESRKNSMRDANMFGELVLIIAAIEQKTAAAALLVRLLRLLN